MLDLDHFKWYNDSYGHLQGDIALKTAGAVIRNAVRDEDTPARYGGEEFIVLLPDVSVSEAQAIGERIRADFEKVRIEEVEGVTLTENQEYHLGTPRKLQCSVGVACFPDHIDDPFELIARADIALYAAKKTRNTVTVYSSGM
jgi:diguanylate cyclase (GGDEF)-like protein